MALTGKDWKRFSDSVTQKMTDKGQESDRPLVPRGRARGLIGVWEQARREERARVSSGDLDPHGRQPRQGQSSHSGSNGRDGGMQCCHGTWPNESKSNSRKGEGFS